MEVTNLKIDGKTKKVEESTKPNCLFKFFSMNS